MGVQTSAEIEELSLTPRPVVHVGPKAFRGLSTKPIPDAIMPRHNWYKWSKNDRMAVFGFGGTAY
ncbi:hypothetical protein ACIQXF_12525 [Lysinibacillus sp. NPDC097231]|uniref:hypothetical protein n=1 Tax=Lysinibacillus sp. NPDC097231 TaxID=3364142 RepID=UPI00380AA230